MNIFKILIPKEKAQQVSELESWTVQWTVATSTRWGNGETKFKCFVSEEEAKEFMKQIAECAKFIGTPVENLKMCRN